MRRSVLLLLAAAAIGVTALIGSGWEIRPMNGNPRVQAKAAIVVEAGTGKTLYEWHADEPLYPASLTKMMTELLILEDIRNGRMKWTDKARFSAYAAGVDGAQTGLAAGRTLSVRDLFNATAVHSANDAAIVLAEQSAGSEEAFVKRMNDKAKAIGLSKYARFYNATGLTAQDLGPNGPKQSGENKLTARDVAKLAAYLVAQHPEVLKTTSLQEVSVPGLADPLRTTDEMLPGERFAFAGIDGLKTGFTDQAGYCFTSTASRGGRRLISVVMGADTSDSRFQETEKLLTYGFSLSVQ